MDNQSDEKSGQSEQNLQCACNVCSAVLEFEQVDSGKTVQCPHCGMDTILFCNERPKAEPQMVQPTQDKKPEIIKGKLIVTQANNPDDVESKLDAAAGYFGFVVFVGVAVAVSSLFVFASSVEAGMFCLFLGISSIASGIITRTIFCAAAEHIRLMKKSNGLKYSGAITQPACRYMCSNCKTVLFGPMPKCENCNAWFDYDFDKDQ
jgi:hypothetical protein